MVGEKGAVTPRALVVGVVAAVVVVVGVAAFLLRGNGSDGAAPVRTPTSPSSTSPSATVSPSVSPTQSAVVAPVLPDAATKPTRAGAEAFMRYFFEVYNHTYRSLDPTLIAGLSLPGCDFCAGVQANASAARDAEQTIEGGSIAVRQVVAAPGKPKDGLIVNALIDQDSLVTKDNTGAVVDRSDAVRGVRVDARVVWSGAAWQVRAVRVLKSGA